MKNIFFIFALACLFSFTSCQDNQNTIEEDTFDPSVIQGTWEMTHLMPADTNTVVPVNFKQYKFYTKDRVFFLAFNQDSIGLIGGGTYTINRDSFTEHLEFMTADMTDAPQNVSFSHKIEGGKFVQTGVIPSISGKNDDYQLEEHYKKVESSIAETSDHPYAGLWKMVQVQNGEATEPRMIPDSIQRMKIITPGHFLIVNWRKNSFDPISAVFGSQKMEDGKYVETILANTMGEMNGISIPYTAEGGEDTFWMYGEIPLEAGPYKINERYTRVE